MIDVKQLKKETEENKKRIESEKALAFSENTPLINKIEEIIKRAAFNGESHVSLFYNKILSEDERYECIENGKEIGRLFSSWGFTVSLITGDVLISWYE
jgi:hypothetical protein